MPNLRWLMLRAESGDALGDMPVQISEECATCRHFRFGLACDAFPKGIPETIIKGDVSHKKPFDGDKGIQYEPADNVVGV